jgi:hypothetical protein
MTRLGFTLTAPLLLVLASCAQDKPGSPAPGGKPRAGIAEIEPRDAEFTPADGQTLYVPAYSSIYTSDAPHEFHLAITLSVRNLDRAEPLVIKSVRYFDHDGQPVRSLLKRPIRVAPLASMEFFIPERDTSGGFAASFLVEWVARRRIADPVVEAVMVGTGSTQGVSFTCQARVLDDLGAPDEPATQP